MTTQAQIEAAARAMFELEYKLMGSDWVIPKWDESHRSHWLPLASAALTAAAEVGGRQCTLQAWTSGHHRTLRAGGRTPSRQNHHMQSDRRRNPRIEG